MFELLFFQIVRNVKILLISVLNHASFVQVSQIHIFVVYKEPGVFGDILMIYDFSGVLR